MLHCFIEKGAFHVSQTLISKKELLELTGISYGQLYRWKRKNLIPEDWFVRKSTFTGQETFFPKDKILERIDKIQTMKENLSLDDLAAMFSPQTSNQQFNRETLVQKGVASESVVSFYYENASVHRPEDPLTFEQIFFIYILEKMLQSGSIQLEEAKMILAILEVHYATLKSKETTLVFIRKLGLSSCLLAVDVETLMFEPGTKVIMQLSLLTLMEELNTLLL